VSRKHPRRRMTGKHFAQIPVEVLTSEACTSLPNHGVRLLLAIAAQYRGNNNGDLAMTWSIGKTFGIDSKKQLVAGIAMLLERELIQKTRQGGKKPLGPCLYAITWQAIDDLRGKIESGPTYIASNAWAHWTSAPQRDQSAINHQHHRGTASAPPGDQTDAISAPQGDQRTPFIGTTGSPPSRSPREGAESPRTAVHTNGIAVSADGERHR
jgi:hypothetical protein